MTDTPTLVRGLAGIPCAESAVAFIDGQVGKLQYRGYRIEDLADQCSFEEVVYLLLEGELPTASQLSAFDADLRANRALPAGLEQLIKAFPSSAHPMDVLQSVIAAMAAFIPCKDTSDGPERRAAVRRLIATMPTIIAAFARCRAGEEPVAPRDDLSHAANFLYMLSAEEAAPIAVTTMNAAFVLHAEHTMNASTFTARVVGSTLADPCSVIAGAIGSLSGPLHGGANERVLHLLDQIGSLEQVDEVIGGKIERKEKIMGLGHRVYKTKDPRAKVLQALAKELFNELGIDTRYEIARRIEQIATELLGHKGIYPNVDFYSGIVYARMGIERDLFTPIFALARVSGWLAHWQEQLEDNRIFRPSQVFTGHDDRTFVSLDQRG
jgi:citrate synthase